MSENVIIGLQLQTDESFEPIVKIVTNELQEITLEVSECAKFLQ